MANGAEDEAVTLGPDIDSQPKKSHRLNPQDDPASIDDDPERISKLYFKCSISNIRCEGLQT